ncbi:GrpB family protein [Clostridioides difficile]
MEGVERYKVRLLPYNQKWSTEFLLAKKQIETTWKDNILDIQHVGSTSINVICAKPILDIAIRLKSIDNMNVKSMIELGYDYCRQQNNNSNHYLYVLRGRNQISLRHIHCYSSDDKEFLQLVGFRDYLNTHHDVAFQYAKLKIKLAKQYPDDRQFYTIGKEEFIKGIYSKLNL